MSDPVTDALGQGGDVQALINQANLAESRGDHQGRAAAASAALAAMTAQYHQTPPANPTDAAGARARLDHLINRDPEFRAQYASGNVEAVHTFNRLNEQVAAEPAVDRALAGVRLMPHETQALPSGDIAGINDMADGANLLREAGLPEQAIKEILTDRPFTSAQHAEAKLDLARRMADPEWRRLLMSGDLLARQQLTVCSAILASGVED